MLDIDARIKDLERLLKNAKLINQSMSSFKNWRKTLSVDYKEIINLINIIEEFKSLFSELKSVEEIKAMLDQCKEKYQYLDMKDIFSGYDELELLNKVNLFIVENAKDISMIKMEAQIEEDTQRVLGETNSEYVESQRKIIEKILETPVEQVSCILLNGNPVSAKLRSLMNFSDEFKDFDYCTLAEKNAIRAKENEIYQMRKGEDPALDETVLVRTPVFNGKSCVGYVENMTTYRKLAIAGIHPKDLTIITLAEITTKISEAKMLKEGLAKLKNKEENKTLFSQSYDKDTKGDYNQSKNIDGKRENKMGGLDR